MTPIYADRRNGHRRRDGRRGSEFSMRRRLLLGGAAGIAALGVAGTLGLERHPARRALWVETVVRRNLPGIRLDEASLATFVREMLAGDLLQPKRDRLSAFADRTVPALAQMIPDVRHRIERLERLVLSEFLLGSNFFRVADPARETIVYHGQPPACSNPFATFA